jgi:putative ABC transport system substrate-binding protein
MTTRRTVIAGVMAWLGGSAVGIHAQQRDRVRRIGVLGAGPPPPDLASANAKEALEQGLRQFGWMPGVDIVVEYRYASGSVDRMREQVAELVGLPVELLVTRGTEATRVAREGTRTKGLPIVMSFVADPVAAGFVRSLARPGGTITGMSFLVQALQGKQLEYLREVHPRLVRVAVLGNPRSIPSPQYASFARAVAAAAAALKLQHQLFEIRTADEMRAAFKEIAAARFDGLLLFTDPFLLEPHRAEVVGLAAKHRLPTVYPWSNYVEVGGLMSYSASQFDLHRRAAGFVDRILKGARPADLPVEQPLQFELVINLKAAAALGLSVPPTVLLRADRIIE